MPKPADYANRKIRAINQKSNAKSKPGPKTAAGKARSCVNATRHGLAGRTVVLPSEDMTEFIKFSHELVNSLRPATPAERELANNIADGYWRLRRVRTTEDSLFALGYDEGQANFTADNEAIHAAYTMGKTFREHSNAFLNLSIYESRIQRGIDRNMKQLQELQANREARREREMTQTLRLRDFNKMQHLPFDPIEDGFVYSPEEIEVEAHRRDRRILAEEAAKVAFNFHEFKKRNEKQAA
jgi:hypothetical protein